LFQVQLRDLAFLQRQTRFADQKFSNDRDDRGSRRDREEIEEETETEETDLDLNVDREKRWKTKTK
jgi:hypothetical protein